MKAKGCAATPPVGSGCGAELTTAGERDAAGVLGEVAWLMSRSAPHRHVFMADLDWLVLPPLYLGQARVLRGAEGSPLAYVSWALASDAVEARLKARIGRLQPTDWRSGPHPWIIDVIAPFGGADKAVAEVVGAVFGGRDVPVLGRVVNGGGE